MDDQRKTKAQLIAELGQLRRQVEARPDGPVVADPSAGTPSGDSGRHSADQQQVERRPRDAGVAMQASDDLQSALSVREEEMRRRADLSPLEQRNRDLEAEIGRRRQVETRLEEDLRREEVLGRLRDQVLTLACLSEMETQVRSAWVEGLRALGLPVHKLSVQWPSACEGYFSVSWVLLPPGNTAAAGDFPLTTAPWVAEAWQSGVPVVVDRDRLAAFAFADAAVQSIIEVPFPGGNGSLGVSSKVPQAFDEGAVHTLQRFAGTVAVTLERLRHLEALRQSEDRLREAQAIGRIGAWEFDLGSHQLTWSDQTYKIYARDPALGPPTPEEEACYYSPEVSQALRQYATRAVEEGQDLEYDLEATLPDGQQLWLSARMRPVKDAHGVVRKLVGTVQDITARRAADERIHRMAQMLDAAPSAITVHDFEGRFRYANQSTFDLHGFTRDEFMALNLHALDVPASEGLIATRLQQLLDRGAATFQVEHLRKDGSILPLEVRARVTTWGAEKVIVSVATDLTERQQAEDAAKVALALQRVRNAILQMHSEADWPNVARTFDQEMRALVRYGGCGINIIDRVRSCFFAYVVNPDAVYMGVLIGHLPAALAQALDQGRPVYRRNRTELATFGDGDIGAEINSVIDIPFAGGTLALNSRAEDAFGQRDIQVLEQFAQVMSEAFRRLEDLKVIETQRRQTLGRLALDLALQRVRAEVLQMQAEEDWARLVAVVDAQLRQVIAFQYSTINVVDLQKSQAGTHSVKARGPYGELGEPDRTMFAKALETGASVYRASRADPLFNQGIPPEVHSVVDVPFAGGTLGVSRTEEDAFDEDDIRLLEQFAPVLSEAHRRLHDLAERTRLERELVRVQRLRVASELSAGVCHNLNNILTGVLLPAQLLQRMTDDDAMRQLIDTIVSSTERATELVHRLHQSVGDRGGTALQAVIVDRAIHRVMDATRPRWHDEPEARGLTVEVHTRLSQTPPIRGTESDFQALLTNLMFNAVDAMPDGGTITIRTQTEGQYVRLDFSDTGFGMDESTRQRLFEPFFTTKASVGTGLGLSTLYSAVNQWGGTVEVDSAPGQGATFTLRLPIWAEATAAVIDARAAATSRSGRIVIIDDNATVGRFLAAALGARHQVDSFLGADQALAQFVASRYDVAIIDLGMPGVPGDQLARRMQSIDPAVVRVMFSGWELAEDDPRRRPFDLQLAKPVQDLDELEGLIAQAIALHDQRAGGTAGAG